MTILPQADKILIKSVCDLPQDRVFIKIKDSLLDDIQLKIRENFKNVNNAQKNLNMRLSLYKWIKSGQFPLKILTELLNNLKINTERLNLEYDYIKSGFYPPKTKNSGGTGKPIVPEFPIRLSESLARVIAHLFADGCLSIDKYGYLTTTYYNQDKDLLKEFKEDTRKVFGFNNFGEGINKTTPYISLPSSIAIILLQIAPSYNSKECFIPDFIKNSSKQIKRQFLKAFFDDEAFVKFMPPQRNIELTINNTRLLKDIQEMLRNDFGITTRNIIERKIRNFEVYSIYIRNHENLVKFNEEIGFSSHKKQEVSGRLIKKPGRISFGKGETEIKMLKLLKAEGLTIREISRMLNRKECTVSHFLNKMLKDRKVKKHGFKNNQIVWEIENG